MSENRPRISQALIHTPAFGVVGQSIGGAEEAIREMSGQLKARGYHGELITTRYPRLPKSLFSPEEYGLQPEDLVPLDNWTMLKGDKILQDDQMMQTVVATLNTSAQKSAAVVPHYYVSLGAMQLLPVSETNAVELALGHTRGRSANVNNPDRADISPIRDRIEVAALARIARGKSLLTIQTQQEAVQLFNLYSLDQYGIDLNFFLNERCIFLPLGVQPEFIELGAMDEQRRANLRVNRTADMVDILKTSGMDFEAEKLHNLPDDFIRMITIGAMRAGKGHKEAVLGLLEALKQDPCLKAALILVGGELEGNPVYEELLQLIRQGDLITKGELSQRVIFTDSQKDSLILPIADVGMVSSRRESFSFFLAKVMAAGLPAILNHDAILMEVAGMWFQGQGYTQPFPFTFDPDDSKSIANAILNTVNNPQFMQAQAERNRNLGKTFTWENRTNRFLTQLRQKGVI